MDQDLMSHSKRWILMMIGNYPSKRWVGYPSLVSRSYRIGEWKRMHIYATLLWAFILVKILDWRFKRSLGKLRIDMWLMCYTLVEDLNKVKHLRNKIRLQGFLDLIADLLINWDLFCCRAILFHSIHLVKDMYSALFTICLPLIFKLLLFQRVIHEKLV